MTMIRVSAGSRESGKLAMVMLHGGRVARDREQEE